MNLGYVVRRAKLGDLKGIVAIHEVAFAGFFLTMLGRAFLCELYRGFIVQSDGICWVAESDLHEESPQLLGFVAGALSPKQHFRQLLFSRGLRFALAAIPGIAMHPLKVLPRVLSALWYRGDQPSVAPQGALLSSLGVNPNVSGRGVGKKLIGAFCSEATALGAAAVYLTTDRDGNDAVNQFYARLGFQLVAATAHRGRFMNTYLRTSDSKPDREQ